MISLSEKDILFLFELAGVCGGETCCYKEEYKGIFNRVFKRGKKIREEFQQEEARDIKRIEDDNREIEEFVLPRIGKVVYAEFWGPGAPTGKAFYPLTILGLAKEWTRRFYGQFGDMFMWEYGMRVKQDGYEYDQDCSPRSLFDQIPEHFMNGDPVPVYTERPVE
jgi:hypothetical protein